ncbi:DNA-binding anti-repressor SinI [Halobacillus sp. A5]|uniref:helix-turn-helix domain-containing protein n=1 Tax=Halobacillus sp. A5 TaxID=2880263 RepID=UPI0020A6632D|nr:DNA-binding anti-repressor SinI [Halobacillus sp. A5]MCP3029515.1 DNA-binding anti-repressor SinI [Halobacillus sp. A5]
MIGDRIHKIRRHRGLSMAELGERAGFAKSYVSSIERQKQTNPSIHFIEQVAKVLDVSVNYLISGETSADDQPLDEGWVQLVREAMESGLSKQQFREYLEFNIWKDQNKKKE